MEFKAFITDYPLRVENMLIFNIQGFFIDSLSTQSADFFLIEPQQGVKSDLLHYFRHSFEQYCIDHQPGGAGEVDPTDPNWHLNDTPHVDYSTLIFAVAGNLNDGSVPPAGSASSELELETRLGDGTGAWEPEREEEVVTLPDDDDGDDDDDDDDD
jgi:hypothetical protein